MYGFDMNPGLLLGLGQGLQQANRAYFDVRGERLNRERQAKLDEQASKAQEWERAFRGKQLGIDQEQLAMQRQDRERNLIKDVLENLAGPQDISPEDAARIKGAGFGTFVQDPSKLPPVGTVGEGLPDMDLPPVGTVGNGLQPRENFRAQPFVPPALKASQDRLEQAMAALESQTAYRNAGLDLREHGLEQRGNEAEARLRAMGDSMDIRRQMFDLQRELAGLRTKESNTESIRAAYADAFKAVPLSPEEQAGMPDPQAEARRNQVYQRRLTELGSSGQPAAAGGPAPGGMVNPFGTPAAAAPAGPTQPGPSWTDRFKSLFPAKPAPRQLQKP